MKLTGNFYLENEKIAFLFVVLDFGKKNIYLQYKNKIYDLRYLINKIKDKKIFFLIKLYYENKIFETIIRSNIHFFIYSHLLCYLSISIFLLFIFGFV